MAVKRKTPALMRSEVVARLEDLPHQILALQSAMEEFGGDFRLAEFKPAFERKSGIKAYNKVPADSLLTHFGTLEGAVHPVAALPPPERDCHF